MIYIYKETTDVLSNWTSEDGLLLLPSRSISNFLVKSLDRYGILKAKEEVLKLVNSNKKNISISQVEKYFTNSNYIDIYSNPNRGQIDKLFEKTVTNIREGKNIYSSLDAFVLFIEWAKDNFPEFEEEIYFEGSSNEIIYMYGKTKVKTITLNNLDRLIKLFCLFYGKSIPKKKIYFISNFQDKLISFDTSFFKDINSIKEIVEEKYAENENLPANNIFNKILEMLENLEMILEGYDKKDDTKLNVLVPKEKLVEKYSTNFKNMLGI